MCVCDHFEKEAHVNIKCDVTVSGRIKQLNTIDLFVPGLVDHLCVHFLSKRKGDPNFVLY